ncbi:MAG: hypothetical protein ACR2FH_05025 [Caulobacteraceae bacterium]
MRRKTAEQNRDGGVTALPALAKQFVHDLDGRRRLFQSAARETS